MNLPKSIVFCCVVLFSMLFINSSIAQDFGGINIDPFAFKKGNAGTIVFSGINGALSTLNVLKICGINIKWSKSSAGFGLVTGVAQITYGIIYSEKGFRGFTLVNSGIGSLAIITSSLRLLQKENKESGTVLNLEYLPINSNEYAMGLRITKVF